MPNITSSVNYFFYAVGHFAWITDMNSYFALLNILKKWTYALFTFHQ